jgi:hypothetical protein
VPGPDELDDPPRRASSPTPWSTPWTHEQSDAWRPEVTGWSTDILPWHREILALLPETFTFVELGVFRGRSLLHLAELASLSGRRGIIHGVDPGYAINFGHPYPAFEGDTHAELLANIVRLRHHRPGVEILIHRLKGTEAARAFERESIDGVFIDASHERADVAEDIDVWTPKVRAGGIVSGHDLDHAQFPGVCQAVNAAYPGGYARKDSVWWVRK